MTRVLAVADSDSYLKWSAATLAAMPAHWERRQVLIRNPIAPSAAQVEAAVGAPVPTLGLAAIIALILRERPDVILLGCTGPVAQVVTGLRLVRTGRRRPVLVSGLPGISVPATTRAVEYRAACDLFLLHSHAERRAFAGITAEFAPRLRIGLARLPFLDHAHPKPDADARDLVFAAQAVVPAAREDRRQVLTSLAAAPDHLRPVVKLRAAPGEEQTHREALPYPLLWDELVAEGRVRADAVRFSPGPMSLALSTAAGFVTVSSTAALEAIASDVPVVVLADFGVTAATINVVFEDSGCLGTLADVRDGRFRTPAPEWMTDNYFHPDAESDWLEILTELLAVRAGRGLAPVTVRPAGSSATRARRRLRLLVPAPLWTTVRRGRSRLRQALSAGRR